MKKLLTLAACAALLSGCDFVGSGEAPAAFSNLTLISSPLPADDDGSGPDLYVEIQDAGGRAIVKADQTYENVTADDFPLVISANGGELVGVRRSYFVVVMDRNDAGGYDPVATSASFTADDLRNSTESVFAVTNERGNIQAQLTLAP